MSKKEVIATIRACAKKLGHPPTRAELKRHTGLTVRAIGLAFGNYTHALAECGLERKGIRKLEMERLFQDWSRVARKLKRIPTIVEYEGHGQFSVGPLTRRFRSWKHVPAGMASYAREQGLLESWKDVLELVEQSPEQKKKPKIPAPMRVPTARADQPVYGVPITGWPLMFAPTNESAVLFLFGAMAKQLGFLALRIQTGYPDCEAMRVVGDGLLQRTRIEIEHESRNFVKHAHKPSGCDLIVCWEHNWPGCPLEVIELKREVERLAEE